MRFYFFIFVLAASLFPAQSHRFIYEVQFKKDSTENLLSKDFYHLDVSQDKLNYYNRDYYILDSLVTNKLNVNIGQYTKMTNTFTTDLSTGVYTEYELLEYELLKLTDTPKQNWTLLNETKTIAGFSAQAAITNWGGRKWKAWFVKDFPLPYGPYKFRGLPGLIAELSDSRGNYNFKLIKNEKLADNYTPVRHLQFFPASISVSRAQYVKKKLSTYEDPLAFLQTTDSNLKNFEGVYLKDGTMVNSQNIREVTATQKRNIKTYNNPIELNKAILYPSK